MVWNSFFRFYNEDLEKFELYKLDVIFLRCCILYSIYTVGHVWALH